MAIIDILTHYDAKKKAAHAAKTVKHGVSISVWFPSLLPASCRAGASTGPLLSWELPSPFHGSRSLQGLHSNAESELPRPLASHLDPAWLFCYPLGLLTDTRIMRILHNLFV